MAAKQKMSKEDRCRKNIATFLDLMEFKDVNPTVTTDELLERLRRIEEKQSTVVSKQSRTIRKITFKFNEKAPVIIPEDPTTVLEIPLFYEGCGGKDIENTEKEAMVTEKDSRKVLSEVENPNFDDDQMVMDEDDGDHGVIEQQAIDNGGAGELLRDFIRESGGSPESAVFVVEKQLTKTDVNRKQARLLMPISQDKFRAFLRAPEKERLNTEGNIKVTVFDPKLRKSTMNLRSWKMNQPYPVLKTGWNEVVAANKLKENTVLQVWSFRVDEELCFALLRVDDDDDDDGREDV
ncbi:hypothetical protein OSB04_010586 [Centaurea solstitialis]|uniref:B3 domain-containing protein n=1 Tax=Centaurea solstitialis TaxID=347529 RepID=A0AA38TQZ6_9ASTR|nr:hypothetical protein OSB04_010586 [Centaurea solstitialis]